VDQIDSLQEELVRVRERVHNLASEVTAIKLAYSTHACAKEQDWGKLWEILKTCTDHVVSGDSVGGFRDRLFYLETTRKDLIKQISDLTKRMWFVGCVSGIMGGLIGTGSKDIILMFISWLMKR